jgi:NADH dehydrogenase/NADH:ubiquinone oxidoreductase subunit G
MGTSSGDTFNLEGKIDMFKHAVVATFVEVIHQLHRVFGVAVITD